MNLSKAVSNPKQAASAVQQEYLAEAYRLVHYQPDDPYITTSALAERVGVSAPAVAAVVERFKKAGYVEHEPYKGMRLTQKGEREALMNIRRHRLSEIFLVKVMGFVLAIIVGILCFGLVKHTADEFDRWYEEPTLVTKLRIPALTGIIASFALVALLVFAR